MALIFQLTPLMSTLQWLSLRHSSIEWMVARRFKKWEECNIWNPILEGFTDACVIKMPILQSGLW